MKIRLLKPWGLYSPGMVIEPGGGVRDMLVRRGLAEVANEPNTARPRRSKHRRLAKGRSNG